jgi:hypothetical protein
MITALRAIALCTVALLMAGCAEKNFVPGSPMAHLFGYNRTYEQIAADDCQAKFDFQPGTDQMQQCVYELSMARRQGDVAYEQTMANIGTVGLMMQPSAYPPARPVTCVQQGIYTTCQ